MRTTIQQAAANALAEYLGQLLPDVVVEPRWPAPDKEKPPLSITVVTAGKRQDTPINLRLLSSTIADPDLGGISAVWQIAACTQPFQLDVWTRSDVERDDILARLDDILNAGESALTGVSNPDPVGHGVLLALGDGWTDSTADFTFDGADYEDLSDSVGSEIFRATIRGDAHFMLTVSSVTARQRVIQFKLALSATDTYPEPDTYTP